MKVLFAFFKAIGARAFESSTYAGLGVFGVALSHSLGLDTPAGRTAFAASLLASLAAVAKKEGTPWINKTLSKLDKSVAIGTEVAPALVMIRQAMAAQKGTPPELLKALDEILKGTQVVDAVEKQAKNTPAT